MRGEGIQPNYRDQVRIFKALCDERRVEIISLLRGGERYACVRLQQMAISQPTLSYHMKILCESGMVTGRQEGKWTHYRLSRDGAQRVIEMLESLMTETETPAPVGGERC